MWKGWFGSDPTLDVQLVVNERFAKLAGSNIWGAGPGLNSAKNVEVWWRLTFNICQRFKLSHVRSFFLGGDTNCSRQWFFFHFFPPCLLRSWSSSRFGLTFCLWPLVMQPENAMRSFRFAQLATRKGCAEAVEFQEIYRSALKILEISWEFKSGHNSNFVLTKKSVTNLPVLRESWRLAPHPAAAVAAIHTAFCFLHRVEEAEQWLQPGWEARAGWDSAVCLLEPHPEQLAIPASASWFLSRIQFKILSHPRVQNNRTGGNPCMLAYSARSRTRETQSKIWSGVQIPGQVPKGSQSKVSERWLRLHADVPLKPLKFWSLLCM